MKLGEFVVSYPCVLQFHQVASKSDEKQKSFNSSPFFCSEFQSVGRIVKIVHSEEGVLAICLSNSYAVASSYEFFAYRRRLKNQKEYFLPIDVSKIIRRRMRAMHKYIANYANRMMRNIFKCTQ